MSFGNRCFRNFTEVVPCSLLSFFHHWLVLQFSVHTLVILGRHFLIIPISMNNTLANTLILLAFSTLESPSVLN